MTRMLKSLWGGGILVFAILTNLPSKELSEICNNGSCTISTPESDITNSTPLSITNSIDITTQVQTFINKSTITATKINIDSNGNYIANFYNYGRIETTGTGGSLESNSVNTTSYKNIYNYGYISGYVYLSQNENMATNIVNYGEMGGVVQNQNANKAFTVDNRGIINLFQQDGNGKKIHFKNIKSLTLQNYAMQITQNASAFNTFDGNASDNSHLVLDNVQSVSFADKGSKMILDFGSGFEFGKGYLLSKLVVDTSGNNQLGVDFSRLVPYSDIYYLTQNGENFIVNLKTESSTIGNLYKSNIRTMNNFYTISNSMIYPRKSYHLQNLTRKNYRNIADSANPLKSYESFAYRNESINRRIQRQNKRNYSRKLQNQTQNLKENQRNLQNLNLDSANHDYYFILTPFVNHNSFAKSGNYNLSGFDYGFLTALSAQVAESNYLGAHFIFSYGSLNDSKDKDLSIKSLNLNVGINYKLDLIYDMYLKARGDFFYFLNQVKTLTMFEAIKPNNLGFGASLIFGKDFDFGKGGVLGIEAGIDYKGLKTNAVSLNSQSYKQSLLNLIYADLGISYAKYFGGFGINFGGGFKANLAPKLAESTLLINSQNLRFTIDNDKYLAYANAGISYVINHKDFDMEFSLAYYGNYGDRVMSNGAGVEFRVVF